MTDPVAPEPRPWVIDHEHRDVNGGWLRPVVFGAMDGLVSNIGLIAGVAGGTGAAGSADATQAVALAGLAGLLAGAFSMGAGEYVSVKSQAELAAAEMEVERRALQRIPEAEAAELEAVFTSRGVDPETARRVVEQLSADPETALEVHTLTELGVTPDAVPSATLAAGSSFLSFAVGALIPLVPYLLGVDSLLLAVAVTVSSLFVCGALVSRVTSRSWWFSGIRQAAIGAAAAGVTYLLGQAVGTGLG
jgi:VIT1/CCC1 family predicted Fe2+/Mn2+ transporter